MPRLRPRPRRAPAVLAAALALAGTPAVGAQLFVPNPTADSVTVYPLTASGDVAPARTLSGPATGIDTDFGLAVDDEHQELFVANFTLDTITVYPLTAAGDAAPVRTIAGPATQLASPIGLFVDPAHDELIVRNYGGQTFLVFARTATGDAAPIRTFSSPAVLVDTTDFTVDLVHDELVVANRQSTMPPGTILVFPRTASGSVTPLREIAGSTTGLDTVYGIAVDAFHDEILVASGSSVRVFARTANGDVAPLRTIAGAATQLDPG
ncbi:MAG: hypothetical protein L0221_15985, partial [Chloroflexi bacterium]|nr:hypothetical protein [Chloroflexota bacterium]